MNQLTGFISKLRLQHKIYNKSSEICCAQRVNHSHIQAGPDRGERRICCGKNLLTAKKSHYCCGSDYVSSNLSCCGRQTPYNASESTCDDDMVVPLRHANIVLVGLYDSKTEICCQGNRIVSNGVLQCCGNGSVNSSDPNEDCCIAGKFGRSYRKNTEKCCNGSVQAIKNTKNATCCGKQLFSSLEQVCCNNNTIINKTLSHHNSCCSRRPGLNSSCSRQVPTKRPKTCGKISFNKQRDLCCNNKLHRDARVNGKRCCLPGTETYHLHNETCCYSMVKDKTKGCFGSNDRTPPTMPGQPGPIRPTQSEDRTKGVCRVCSSQWKPNAIILSIYSKDTNICTQKGKYTNHTMKFVVNKVHQLNTVGLPMAFKWTWLSVTSKHNIYGEKGTPALKQNFTLVLPCACPKLKTMEGQNILLMTNAEFNKEKIFLGDSDLILPGRKKVLQLVKKQSKTCPNYVVQNIAFLIQMSSIG
ncbi:uncharacterized protein LOC133187951 [Saccostrea echinata]|uniref:uncharacterized protein LOC133187951 n=1 Tax=Saccostrea echinata TaxID=191078 RepID=UPI002A81189D|nr:uncharacterized protein LOC133187951 [Saccostrea echinata]